MRKLSFDLNVLQEIERLKNEKPTWERRMRWDGMKAVFGSPPSLLWCNPFTGLRLRRLLLLTHVRRGGSEFSVWESGLSGTVHQHKQDSFYTPFLHRSTMELCSLSPSFMCGWPEQAAPVEPHCITTTTVRLFTLSISHPPMIYTGVVNNWTILTWTAFWFVCFWVKHASTLLKWVFTSFWDHPRCFLNYNHAPSVHSFSSFPLLRTRLKIIVGIFRFLGDEQHILHYHWTQ